MMACKKYVDNHISLGLLTRPFHPSRELARNTLREMHRLEFRYETFEIPFRTTFMPDPQFTYLFMIFDNMQWRSGSYW